jgi:hypothetical protein
MLDEIDEDGTGEIDFAEFLQFVVSTRKVEGKRAYTEKESAEALIERQFKQMLGFIRDKGLGEQYEKYVDAEQGVLVTDVLKGFRGLEKLDRAGAALRLQKLFRRRQMRILLNMKPWSGRNKRADTAVESDHQILVNPLAPVGTFSAHDIRCCDRW